MKWAIYSVVVLFLAGGAVCTQPMKIAEATAPELKPDDPQPVAKISGAETADEKKGDTPSFTNDVSPFLAKYCVNCHNNRTAKAGYNFDSFESLTKGGRKGPAVVAGDPDKSAMVRSLDGKGKKMPPAKFMHQPKAEEIALLKAWIAAGAKDDGQKGE